MFDKKPRTIETVAEAIRSGAVKRIVVMSGAGISVSAGIPDFRSPGTGLYDNLQKYNLPTPEAIFEINYFRSNPKAYVLSLLLLCLGDTESNSFYTLAKELLPGTHKPTPTHYFLRLVSRALVARSRRSHAAPMQLQDKGLLLRIYTQNIDTLERVAGIDGDKLVEAHGCVAAGALSARAA